MGGTDGRGPEGADKKKKKKTKRGARRNARYYCHYCDKNLANNYLGMHSIHKKTLFFPPQSFTLSTSFRHFNAHNPLFFYSFQTIQLIFCIF